MSCQETNDWGMTFCNKCGESLDPMSDALMENYFQASSDMNFMS